MKPVDILPLLKPLIYALALTPAVGMAVVELSDQELNQAAAETNAPESIVENAVIRDQAQICADPEPSSDALPTASDQSEESSAAAQARYQRCIDDPRLAANDPLNNQPADQFYNNLNDTLENNREFLEQNPFSGNLINVPRSELNNPLPDGQFYQPARDLTLQLGESLRRMNMAP